MGGHLVLNKKSRIAADTLLYALGALVVAAALPRGSDHEKKT